VGEACPSGVRTSSRSLRIETRRNWRNGGDPHGPSHDNPVVAPIQSTTVRAPYTSLLTRMDKWSSRSATGRRR
jgi:hypothetical protein